jgi:hypothetical protein
MVTREEFEKKSKQPNRESKQAEAKRADLRNRPKENTVGAIQFDGATRHSNLFFRHPNQQASNSGEPY